MTTVWHVGSDRSAAYARGALEPAQAASVEQHLQRCAQCRDTVGRFADHGLVAQVWPDIIDELDRRRVPVAERIVIRLGLRPELVRLAVGASAVRRAWTAALTFVAVFALVAPGVPDGVRLWFLAMAPLIPLAAVAAAYGPRVDPMFEVVAASPYPTVRLLMLRCLAVFPAVAVLVALAGLLLPGGWSVGVLWLLPALGLSLLTLALEPLFGQRPVVAVVAVVWIAVVAITYRTAGSVLPVFGVAGQVLFAVVAVAAAATIVRGRLEVWRV